MNSQLPNVEWEVSRRLKSYGRHWRSGDRNFRPMIIIYYPCGSTVLQDPGRLTYRRFLELFRHMVGLFGRVISPSSQGLYLHRTTQHRKTRDKPCLERDSNPRSQQPTCQNSRLRPHGHCDRRPKIIPVDKKHDNNNYNYYRRISHQSHRECYSTVQHSCLNSIRTEDP
jgi:hypothetical protein